MAQKKNDIIIEAVRYSQDGNILFVRGYRRRGDTYSDSCLFTRDELIQFLKNGKNVAIGTRQPLLASTFKISDSVHLSKNDDHLIVISGKEPNGSHDVLKGVPIL